MSILDRIQARVAALGGDIWRSWQMIAIWPFPATLIGIHHGKFKPDDYRCFTRYLKPGDFLISRCEPFFLSNRAIAGTAFKHLAVFTGAVSGWREPHHDFVMKPRFMGYEYEKTGRAPDRIFEETVTHAVSEGVVTQDLLSFLFHCDYVAAVRPTINSIQASAIVKAALNQVGLEYNFDFKPSGPPALYCTELGAFCLKEVGITAPEKVLVRTSLTGSKSPVSLADYFIKFPMICCSISCSEPWFVRASALREPMRMAIYDARDAKSMFMRDPKGPGLSDE